MFNIKKYALQHFQRLYFTILLIIAYIMHIVQGVFFSDIIAPQLLLIIVFITGIRVRMPLTIIVMISILYDALFIGVLGQGTIPLIICYYIVQQYAHLHLDRQSTLVRCIIFLCFLMLYYFIYCVLLYGVLPRPHAISYQLLLLQFIITWAIQPFIYVAVIYLYNRLHNGL